MSDKKVLVLKVEGLSDEQIKEEFSDFFSKLVEKYPDQFGVGLSAMKKGTNEEEQILLLADL